MVEINKILSHQRQEPVYPAWSITTIAVDVATQGARVSADMSLTYFSRNSWPHYQHALHWRHNDYDGGSNHQPHGCLLNRLFRRRSKKTSKLRVTGLCVGNSPGPVNSLHKGPVTRKMFPFDDVIMWINFNPAWIITSIIKCGMKSFIHSQTSTMQPA